MRSMHYCLVVNWNCAGSPTDCHRSEKKRSRQQAAIYGPTERCQMSCFRTLRRTLSNVPRKFRYSSSSTPSNICSSMGRRHVEILQLLRDVGVPPRHDAIHQVGTIFVGPAEMMPSSCGRLSTRLIEAMDRCDHAAWTDVPV